MENLSYMQQYFICIVNEKGNIPRLNGMNVTACLVVGEITELIRHGYVIWDEENRISVVKPFDDSLTYLKKIYETIAYFKSEDVLRTVDIYASNVCLNMYRKSSLDDLLALIGNSLAAVGCASELPKKGLSCKGAKYAPKPEIVTHIIEKIRLEFLENNIIMDETLCLVALLEKSDIISNYFRKSEIALLRQRMKVERESAVHTSIKKTLDYIDDVTRIMSDIYWG